MLVRDYMTTKLILMQKGEPVQKAKRIFEENDFRHLPVMDDGRIVGVFSDRDLNRTLAISEAVKSVCGMETCDEIKIDEIMNSDFTSISGNEHLKMAARLMMEKKIGCLPVMEGERLVGIITETDILKVFTEIAD